MSRASAQFTARGLTLSARAARCALALSLLTPPRPPGMTGEMALHTALAFGTVSAMHVGGLNDRFEFFITGHQVRPFPLWPAVLRLKKK